MYSRRALRVLFCLWVLVCLAAPAAAAAAGPAGEPFPERYLPQPPTKMTLCGERVPLDDLGVAEMFDREFHIMVHDQAQVVMWLKRAQRYFPFLEKRLKEAGLPDDLKYLAVVESSLIGYIASPAGAKGYWQFIKGTGRRYGLRHDRYFDDRVNLAKATVAAMAYLKELHQEFGTWPLAMAAYNCGESRVKKEIEEQGVADYYQLYLPNETERYVYRVLAAKAILSDPERYGYHLPKERRYRPVPTDEVTLKLVRPLHLRILARAAHTTFRVIKDLNPEIRGYYLPAGEHRLRVPEGQGKGLDRRLQQAMLSDRGPRPKGETYVVKSGDTLAKISRQTGVKIQDLRQANDMDSGDHLIRPGQRLLIPEK